MGNARLRCPVCGGTDIQVNTLHNMAPLEDQSMYACRNCGEWFDPPQPVIKRKEPPKDNITRGRI